VIEENESEVVLCDGELVDPSRVYLGLVLVVVPAVAFSAKVHVL
jgi:hypothetical protein